jgi:acetylornithine deacetylase
MRSVSRDSNEAVSDYLQTVLEEIGCQVERLTYVDENEELKVNLIGKLGEGQGGLAFCSHSDTVPGQEVDWAAFDPVEENGRLYGRGSCDMKGPLAATIVAASQIDAQKLTKPIYIVVTSDEETGLTGAKFIAKESKILTEDRPEYGVIAEPTTLIPVYAHKGGVHVTVTSTGVAAHSSTDKGVSANFQLARFMAEMADLRELAMRDKAFMDDQFSPPTNGFNMTMTDFNTAGNVTAPKAVCRVGFRAMPNADNERLGEMIINSATKFGLSYEMNGHTPLIVSTDSPLVKTAVSATGRDPETVSYGTDGLYLQDAIPQMVVLGPGDIGVAHTVGEYVPLEELETAVVIYRKMIEDLCMS